MKTSHGTTHEPAFAFFRRMLYEGAPRSVQAKQNILGLFLLRGVSMAISLVLVPLTLAYLAPSRYGIWMTMSSILGWVMWLDIGLGNGLRNRFALALAHDDKELARSYVSTTYLFVGLISIGLFLVFLVLHCCLDQHPECPPDMEQELSQLAVIVFLSSASDLWWG
jgi:O-antigen/teichoic acid export membrane protein